MERDIHFLRKQKMFHKNPGINPDTGKRLIHGKGPYLKLVELYGLAPEEDLTVRISFPLQLLHTDLLEEILKYLDSTTKISLLIINRYVNVLSIKYKDDIVRAALQRELKYAKETYKAYFKRSVLEINLGDRLNDGFHNYKVIEIKARTGKLHHVDMLGNKIEDRIYDLEMTNVTIGTSRKGIKMK